MRALEIGFPPQGMGLPATDPRPVQRARVALQMMVIVLVASVILLPLLLYFTVRQPSWQLSVVSILQALTAFGLYGAIRLLRQARPAAGIWAFIGLILLGQYVVAALLAGTGLVLGLINAAIIMLLAAQTLPPAQSIQAIAVGGVANVGAGLIDLATPPFQVQSSSVAILFPAAAVAVLLGFLFLTLRRFSRQNLSTKLILAFLVVSLLPMAAISIINFQDTRASLTYAANRAILTAAQQTADRIDRFIQNNLEAIETEADFPALLTFLSSATALQADSLQYQQAMEVLDQLSLQEKTFILAAGLLNDKGVNQIDANPDAVGTDESARPYFQALVQDSSQNAPVRSYVSTVEQLDQGAGLQLAAITFSHPIVNDDGRLRGVLRVQYDAQILQFLVETSSGLGGLQSYAILLDENLIYLGHGMDPGAVLHSFRDLPESGPDEPHFEGRLSAAAAFEQQLVLAAERYRDRLQDPAAPEPLFSAIEPLSGERPSQVAAVSLDSQPWIVAYLQPQAVFLGPIQTQTRNALMFANVAANAIILAAAFLTQLLSGPIVRLNQAAQAVAGGDLQSRAPVESEDEIGALAASFNSMTTRLGLMVGQLEERVAERTHALKTSAAVSQNISTLLEQDRLLGEVVSLIQSAFDYYHVQIFLLDSERQILTFESGSGDLGRQMRSANLEIPLDEGLIGRVATTNRSVLANDVTKEALWVHHPWLTETLSELAIPISVGERVLGVLDIQQSVRNGFTELDADLMRSIANQIAIALENARQYSRERLRAEEVAALNRTVRRADELAQRLLDDPRRTLVELYALADTASQDPEAASLVSTLPNLLEKLNAPDLSELAQAFSFLHSGQMDPEVLPIGLRRMVVLFQGKPEIGLEHVDEVLAVYRICLVSIHLGTVGGITSLRPTMTELSDPARIDLSTGRPHPVLAGLTRFMPRLLSVIDALHAYERVDAPQDKLAYLASALERVQHTSQQARAELNNIDRAIVQAILENWLTVVTHTMTELQAAAQIECRLLTRQVWKDDALTLTLNVINVGQAAALNIAIAIESKEVGLPLAQITELDRLSPGEEKIVELAFRPQLEPDTSDFRIRFQIKFEDPRGPRQTENFADRVFLLSKQDQFTFIPNPYVVGTPLGANSPLFFGREDVIDFIEGNLSAAHRNNLVLIGQRRTGKTSLLLQLAAQLGEEYLPIYLDGQTLGLDPGLANFYYSLAVEISFAMEDCGIAFPAPRLEDFSASPAMVFEHDFLARVRGAVDGRHLLLLLDEFEELESAVKRGHLDASVFGFMRHLIQHVEDLSVIFCGTHRLEELASDYWNILFNISLYRHIAYLEKDQAMRLIQEPVAPYGLQYDDLALEKMWHATAGHPYFLQLLCHSLVNLHNKSEKSYVTVSDVNMALLEILTAGEAHFVYLWTDSTPDERLALTAISRMIPVTGRVRPIQVVDFLAEKGVRVSRKQISEAMHRLRLREVLQSKSNSDLAYQELYYWKLGLLGMWAEKYKSLSRVIAESRPTDV